MVNVEEVLKPGYVKNIGRRLELVVSGTTYRFYQAEGDPTISINIRPEGGKFRFLNAYIRTDSSPAHVYGRPFKQEGMSQEDWNMHTKAALEEFTKYGGLQKFLKLPIVTKYFNNGVEVEREAAIKTVKIKVEPKSK